ncbi:MAG: hypothetical protein ABI863_04635 [Ginsengibacter sp.]
MRSTWHFLSAVIWSTANSKQLWSLLSVVDVSLAAMGLYAVNTQTC